MYKSEIRNSQLKKLEDKATDLIMKNIYRGSI